MTLVGTQHYDRPGGFSAAQCARIAALSDSSGPEPATVWTGAAYEVEPSVRRAAVARPPRSVETEWLYARLDLLFSEAAAALGVEVGPVAEPVQLLRYRPGDHFQCWHTDAGADLIGERRLSLSAELAAAADYEGGDLEIPPALLGRTRGAEPGFARIFPATMIHRVTPVTRGERRALVAWAG